MYHYFPLGLSPWPLSPVPSSGPGPTSPRSTIRREGSIASVSSATSRFDSEKVHIPNYWREDTQTCIEEGVLDDESRSDICRTLVTLLVSKHGSRPGRVRCEEISAREISARKYVQWG